MEKKQDKPYQEGMHKANIALDPIINNYLSKHYVKCDFSDECDCESELQNWTRLDPETGEAENYWCTICAIENLIKEQQEGDGYVIFMLEKKISDIGEILEGKQYPLVDNIETRMELCKERIMEP